MAVSIFQWRVSGIEPAGVRSATAEAQRAYWQTVVSLTLEVKDRELAAGLDRRGRKMAPIHALTKRARRDDVNSVTGTRPYSPMGRAHPLAPPLQATGRLSRTRSLLRGKVDGRGAVFWWDVDPHTGKDWGLILQRHARGFNQHFRYPRPGWGHVPSRDVFGISPRGLAEVKQRAARWWNELGAGLARHAPPPQPAARNVPGGGSIEYETIDYRPYHVTYHTRGPRTTARHPGDFVSEWGVVVPKRPGQPPRKGPVPPPRPALPPPAAKASTKASPRKAAKLYAEKQLAVNFTPSEPAKLHRDVTVTIDVSKARKLLAAGSEIRGIDEKYVNFLRFLARARRDKLAIEQPRVGISAEGELVIIDGRHRFAIFSAEGAQALPVSVARSVAEELFRLFGFIVPES